MERLYRKVFTKDRLPDIKDGEWIDTSLGDFRFFSNQIQNWIWKLHSHHSIEWWLEEVEVCDGILVKLNKANVNRSGCDKSDKIILGAGYCPSCLEAKGNCKC